MSADLAALVPQAMAPFCRAVVVQGRGGLDVAPLDAASLRDALDRFARGFDRPDRAALASLWSMYHLNAVIIPAVADLLCRDRILPVATESMGVDFDPAGLPTALVLPEAGRPATPDDGGRRFDTLVRGHLVPFVALLSTVSPVTPRVLWSNAGTILDWACTTIGSQALPAPKRESSALLTGPAAACDPEGRLAGAVRDLPGGCRERRVCCMRFRLAGCSPCLPGCPARVAAAAPASATPPLRHAARSRETSRGRTARDLRDASPLASAGAHL